MMMVVGGGRGGDCGNKRKKRKERSWWFISFLDFFWGIFVFSWRCSGKQLGNDLVENATTTTTTAAAAVQVGYIEGT
jgi:hypothetical protein